MSPEDLMRLDDDGGKIPDDAEWDAKDAPEPGPAVVTMWSHPVVAGTEVLPMPEAGMATFVFVDGGQLQPLPFPEWDGDYEE